MWRAIKARLRDQYVELEAIRRALKPGDTAVDVGANKGSYLLWLSRWVKHGQVVAFEPQVDLANYLREACRALSLTNVTVESKAVSNAPGERILYLPHGERSSSASLSTRVADREACDNVPVPAVTLDEYFATVRSRVKVVKIDVEGYERSVFQGAEKLLTEQSPLLVFECENRHLAQGDVQDVFNYLIRLGYAGAFVEGRKLRPISEFRVEKHQRQDAGRYWDAKAYCNNFIFSKSPLV
jgi:FkbM family methyltransferase